MRDLLTAGVRTAVQVAVSAVLVWASKLGLDIDGPALEALLFSVATGVVTMGLNWVAQKVPAVGTILSLGLTSKTPRYH